MRERVAALCVVLLLVSVAFAVPRQMNFQGKLTDTTGVALDGTYGMTFVIYNVPTGGTPLWSETHTSVEVTKGLFDVVLGSTNPLDLPFDSQYWLEVVVEGEAMAPRLPLTSAAYAFRAAVAESVTYLGPEGDNDWIRLPSAADSVLFTANCLGIARGGAGNALIGDSAQSFVNLGVACTTGSAAGPTFRCITVGGGYGNVASNSYATVAGGYRNKASGGMAFVGGGFLNSATSDRDVVAGGYHNTASGGHSAILGGYMNTVSGSYSVVPGGYSNAVSGSYSFAFGRGVSVSDDFRAVFFSPLHPGRLGVNTASPAYALDVNGDVRAAGALHIGNVPDDPTADSVLTIQGGQVMKVAAASLGGGVSISQGTGIICSPNPITGTGTISFDTTWGDSRYVNEGQPSSISSGMLVDGACLSEIVDDDGAGSGLDADMLDGYHASDFALSTHTHCGQRWSCADSGLYVVTAEGYALWGTTTDSAFAAVRGDGGSKSAGVYGTSSDYYSAGVFGVGMGTDGVYGYASGYLLAGVHGSAPLDTVGWAIYGLGDEDDGALFGVISGVVGSWYSGTAVTGIAKSIGGYFAGDTTALAWGCLVDTRDENGIALRARSLSNTTNGYNYAVYATCSTGVATNASDSMVAFGAAVYAINDSDSGSAIVGLGNNIETMTVLAGGSGVVGNGTNVGVFGYGDTTSASFGMIGRSAALNGIGVMGSNFDLVLPATIDSGAGVVGYSNNVGVFGWGDTTKNSFGVYGISDNTAGGRGVVGLAPYIGTYGESDGTADGLSGFGVYGYARDNPAQTDAGVYGSCENTTSDWAGYFSGDLYVANDFYVGGAKSALLRDGNEWRAVYCVESPEVWLEEFGSGKLAKGRAYVKLPQEFLKNVTIANEHPMKVFVQLTDTNCNGVAVIKHDDGFEVVELGGGTSSATFDWRVVAKRKGYENVRYERVGKVELKKPSAGAQKQMTHQKEARWKTLSSERTNVDDRKLENPFPIHQKPIRAKVKQIP